jgi:hypothetical protein
MGFAGFGPRLPTAPILQGFAFPIVFAAPEQIETSLQRRPEHIGSGDPHPIGPR